MKTLVLTSCFESATRYASLTIPSIASYAKKHKHDFKVLRDRKFPGTPPTFEKFRIKELLSVYDRILWVDCDVYIKNSSPDIFAETSGFCARIDSYSCNLPENVYNKLLESKVAIEKRTGRVFNIDKILYNMGIIMFDKDSIGVFGDGFYKYFKDNTEMHQWMWKDQAIFNLHIQTNNIKVGELDKKWNAVYFEESPEYLSNDAYFIHFAGPKSNILNDISSMMRMLDGRYKKDTNRCDISMQSKMQGMQPMLRYTPIKRKR